jgi:hypothetical protein
MAARRRIGEGQGIRALDASRLRQAGRR